MGLPDGPRQVVAGLVASVVFIALYFGAALVWWAAFGLSAIAYAGLLLTIPRRKPLNEVMLTSRVSQADIRAASQALAASARRLRAAAEVASEEDAPEILRMVTHVTSIREQVENEPEDFRRARRLVMSYLPHMVETVESYVALRRKTQGAQTERLGPIRDMILEFAPALERIDAACLENDFVELEAQVEALATQMKRG